MILVEIPNKFLLLLSHLMWLKTYEGSVKDELERQTEVKIKMAIGLRLRREVVEIKDLKAVAAARSEEKEIGDDVELELLKVLHLYNIIVLEDEQLDQCFTNLGR